MRFRSIESRRWMLMANYEISDDQMAQLGIYPLYTAFLPPQEEGKEGNRMPNYLQESIQRLSAQLSRSLQSVFEESACLKEHDTKKLLASWPRFACSIPLITLA